MAERSSAIFWVLCPKQSLHCYIWNNMNARGKCDNVLGLVRVPLFLVLLEIKKVVFCIRS
ncbi:MAG: hypothetical protein IM597_19605 [Pseudanabaena sp. M176S2SP2A07QC]|nr:hypothetical protein [Pseudanabaena sp. M090S1SP2A07QC]MCA6506405.1 hypothetical protein [Pseudanabaena sp. M172S2SP2A07QC]MCA6520850.1 hypothetical protein [Pseudanabaena sp. M051S1SP2A07QC]MCA6525772.1 hypothetical protein [Pseudanabaena sp. M179S2SP2A07QC]MCA6536289.1 hypothetical protein [Pseudanabaena sp. M176S2SP2A07QC]MCA6539506.1 hypothetical protein [Pseudanabaena sp. M037S2SP2A07QC]MCA6561730.1 hypothetical protein [Pseudanabaena sp. M079S1SP2A07QC]MCA6563376.1 hypothetical prot